MKWNVGFKIGAGFTLALTLMAVIGTVSYRNTVQLVDTAAWVSHTHEVLESLESVLSHLRDAETGQRGFLVTGAERYLEPYTDAHKLTDEEIDRLRTLTRDNPNQQQRISRLEPLVVQKFEELQETIDARGDATRGLEVARKIVLTDLGKKYNAVLNNPDGSTGGWVVGDEAFSSFDLDATLAGKSVGLFGDFAMTGLQAPADGQYLLWDEANGYWKPGDINFDSGAVQSITADVTGSVFGDDSTLLVDGVNSKVLLNNGVINIDNDSVVSTTAIVNISNPTEPTSTVLQAWNRDYNSAIRINSLNGATDAQVSGMVFNGYYGGFTNLDGSLSGNEIKGTAGYYISSIVATAFDPDFNGGTKVFSSGISFRLDPNGTIANDQAPGQIEFYTNAGTNSTPDVKGMIFDSAGRLGVNRADARSTVDINGVLTLEPQAAAPATPIIGMIAVANKVDWDPASSVGSTPYPVFWDGSAWVSMV